MAWRLQTSSTQTGTSKLAETTPATSKNAGNLPFTQAVQRRRSPVAFQLGETRTPLQAQFAPQEENRQGDEDAA